jgi:hypothetical protein
LKSTSTPIAVTKSRNVQCIYFEKWEIRIYRWNSEISMYIYIMYTVAVRTLDWDKHLYRCCIVEWVGYFRYPGSCPTDQSMKVTKVAHFRHKYPHITGITGTFPGTARITHVYMATIASQIKWSIILLSILHESFDFNPFW